MLTRCTLSSEAYARQLPVNDLRFVSFIRLFMVQSEGDHSSNYGVSMRLWLSRWFLYLWVFIFITLRWFKWHWQQLLLRFNLSKSHITRTYVCIYTCDVILSELKAFFFLTSRKLHVFRAESRQLVALYQTTTQHPNDSIIRSIISVIILLIWRRAGGWLKNEGSPSSSLLSPV